MMYGGKSPADCSFNRNKNIRQSRNKDKTTGHNRNQEKNTGKNRAAIEIDHELMKYMFPDAGAYILE